MNYYDYRDYFRQIIDLLVGVFFRFLYSLIKPY